ncbi:NAD/FAD-dependent oxidoreductase [Halorubrum sp. GN11_10-6_MGM]|uniref:NAD(P)/FAD-dependent oxidoreductase n=1 Tax=Halorubrum sp. GN11_10-6_MGM TaxID=2518112 RepID=UPI0010F4F353|nr:FAD-dependent oxidoreductase [Halorubrum sp. GN11_10-6_MGM]TKX74214.1 NAD/FAD-dependent oxidoreductase [Halorubrum sp. GN11_10-6_MGM]
MTDVGIVGAGAGAAAAAFVIDETVPDADVTVFEKSGGLCGRAATRRHDDLTYDYGANYLKSDDDRVVDLVTEMLDDEGLVDVTEPVYTFDADEEVSPGRDADDHKWSYRRGLTQIAKRLFDRTDATVHRRTRIETVRRVGSEDAPNGTGEGRWELDDADGETHGPFDVLLMNPPAPQTAELLRTAEWDDPLRETLVDAVGDVEYGSVWTAILRYPFALDVPYYALVNTDKEHAVGWISREECKAGHVPDGETLLVVQANDAWSAAHYDDDPVENVDALAEHTADIVGDERLADPAWTDHQGWRYALPEGGVDRGPVDSARDAGLYLLGDWVAGEGRLHAAIANGLDVGERVAYAI